MRQNTTVKTGRFNRAYFGVDDAYTGVLAALGLPADQVETLKGVTAETLKDFKPEDYVTKIKTGLENTFLNDPAFLSKITKEKIPEALRKDYESGQYARFMNEYKDFAVKVLGLDLSDLTTDEEKSLKKVAEKVTAKYAGKLGSPEALKTIQTELQKALSDNNDFKTNYVPKTELQTALATAQGQTNELLTKLITQTELNKIEGGLVVDASYLVDSIVAKAREAYTVKLEGTQLVIKRKENPELDVTNSDGSKKTYSQLLGEIAKEMKIVKDPTTKTKEETGTTKTTVTVQGNEVKLPAHIANKVNANIKAEGGKV